MRIFRLGISQELSILSKEKKVIGVLKHVNLFAGLALFLTVFAAYGADDPPSGAVRITSEELKWKPGRVPGHEIAPLIGDSTKPGAFVARVKFPTNRICQAHSHSEDRTYTIISGTWYVGYGDKFDPEKLKALPAGSFFTEPGNVNHFSLTKEDGLIVRVTGVDPSATKFVDAPKK